MCKHTQEDQQYLKADIILSHINEMVLLAAFFAVHRCVCLCLCVCDCVCVCVCVCLQEDKQYLANAIVLNHHKNEMVLLSLSCVLHRYVAMSPCMHPLCFLRSAPVCMHTDIHKIYITTSK